MYCNNCGNENRPDAKFCTRCGAPLQAGPADSRKSGIDGSSREKDALKAFDFGNADGKAENGKKKKNKKLIIAVIAVLLAALAAVGIIAGRYLYEAHQWQEYYDSGQKYLSEEKYDEAITVFTNAIEINDRKPMAYVGRGDAYTGKADMAADEGSFEEAVMFYGKAADDYKSAKNLEYKPAENKLENVKNATDTVKAKQQEQEEAEKAAAFFEEHRQEAEDLIENAVDPDSTFDCNSSDLGKVIFDFMVGPNGMCNMDVVTDYYGVKTFEDYYISEDDPDPQNRILWGYNVHDGEGIDWYIENVFNMKPDHNVEYKRVYDGVSEDLLYYFDGKYYVQCEGWGGDSGFNIFNINDVESVGDDTYIVRYSGTNCLGEACSGEVKLKGKTINGNFYWTFLSWS